MIPECSLQWMLNFYNPYQRENSMPVWFYLLIGGVILLYVLIFVLAKWRRNQQLDQGFILPRTSDFVEYTEIFTMRAVDFSVLADRISRIDMKLQFSVGNGIVRIESGYRMGRRLSNHSWGAVFYETETPDGSTDYSIFRFQFTHFVETGTADYADEMNRLLTAVEKIILTFDRNAWVQSEKTDFNSKLSFW